MKRLLGLLVCVVLFNSCDDGDLTVESFDFSARTSQRCDNKIYKLNGNEALILQVPFDQAFINNPTSDGLPIVFPVNATNFVLYRSYNGTLTAANICAAPPPATPNVSEEWIASSGNIEIVTTAVKLPNPELEGGQIINEYRHTITFRNITFQKPDGTEQRYETLIFGTYDTGATTLPFNFDETVDKCTGSNTIYNFVGNEGLTLEIDSALITNEITSAPRVGLIGTTLNRLVYRQFVNGTLNAAYFCTIPVPATPVASETWIANDGITNVSGIIEVSTTTGVSPNTFEHTIHLKNVTFKKGNSEFILASDYLFGKLITN